MKTIKAMHTSPRRAACNMNYLDSDSSQEDNDSKNDELDQNREEVVKALVRVRSMIDDLERHTSMNEDEDDQDETVEEEKQEDSSFIQKTTTTQVDFPDEDSISSGTSSVIPVVTAVSSEVVGQKTEYGGQDSMYIEQKREEEKREGKFKEEENSQG